MNKVWLTFIAILIIFQIQGCSEILETVSLSASGAKSSENSVQEEFEINIKSLNFDTARIANSSAYPRKLMLLGSGSKANVFNESEFLSSKLPTTNYKSDYRIGVGDELKFVQLNEYLVKNAEWLSSSEKPNYKIGVGDELSFVQLNDSTNNLTIDANNTITTDIIQNELVFNTKGIVDSKGNILLLQIGNINVAGRTLESVRTEVRNILIRKGLAPNFQIEITKFESQKAFLAVHNGPNKIITINNLPTTLREVILSAGVSETAKNFTIISLSRDDNISQTFEISAGELFNANTPEIYIKDNDIIRIRNTEEITSNHVVTVGSKGNILLPQVGRIKVVNKTLDDVYKEIKGILLSDGFIPNFQLEIIKFASKKAYIIQKGINSRTVPLTSTKITLRELILQNESNINPENGLTLVTLNRNGEQFRAIAEQVLDSKTSDVWINDGDQIEIQQMAYKPGQVFALTANGVASIVSIKPSRRETLADILFVEGGTFNNVNAKRSEVYLLRGQKSPIAYHLDTKNVSRILVAAKTELRPNDIIYVAERPIISFARTLSELTPLRILLRDIEQGNIP